MMCCCCEGCDNPRCLVCSVSRRFAAQIALQRRGAIAQTEKEAEGLKDDARALAGTQPRPSRDPRFIKRTRKALTP